MVHRALRLTREFHRMKQVELARRLSISTSYLSEIESGKKPVSLELLERYAEVFNIPASTFLLFKEQVIDPADAKRKERAAKLLKFFEWVVQEEDDQEKEPSKTGAPEKAIRA